MRKCKWDDSSFTITIVDGVVIITDKEIKFEESSGKGIY
jgi:hypothetical protein